MTLAPRSWPSRPGLATSTRMGTGFSGIAALLIPRDHEVRHPQQGPFVVGFRQPGDGRAGHFSVLEGSAERILHRPVALQNIEDVLVAGSLEAEIFEHPADGLALVRVGVLQRMDHGE